METIIKRRFNLVSRWCFPEDSGGVAMHNYYLSQVLQTSYDFRILSFNSLINKKSFNNSNVKYLGISVSSFINFNLSTLKNILRSFSDYSISKRFSDKIDIDSGIIEFMDIHSEGYYYLKNNPSKRKNVVIRSHTPFGLLKKYFNKDELLGVDTWFAFEREKKCFHWVKNITTPSVDLKNQLINIFNINSEKITVIPNILDTHHFKPEKKSVSKNIVILHVGRFERAKGVETLIKSFIQIAKKYQNVELINVGSPRGNALKKCQIELSKHNLSDRVMFTGFVPYDNLPSNYHKADLVVVSSEIYESFSYTVAQGMACGKAVVASQIGGIPETLNHGKAGALFNPRDHNQLSEKIEELINNKTMREELGMKAREFAVDNYSIEALKPKYVEYYQSIMA